MLLDVVRHLVHGGSELVGIAHCGLEIRDPVGVLPGPVEKRPSIHVTVPDQKVADLRRH